MITNALPSGIRIAQRKIALFMIKLAEPWSILIVRLWGVILMELAPVATAMRVTVPKELMGKPAMNQNTNVTRPMKPNATPRLVQYHLIIARIEKKKFARNLLKWFLFQLKSKIA